MLSVQLPDFQQPFYHPLPTQLVCNSCPAAISSMGGLPRADEGISSSTSSSCQSDTTVAQALEIARESPDGARDPVISSILEAALAHIWARVKAQPDSYVMTRDEFAVFNYFQNRFKDNATATAARRRYWDNARG